MMRIAFFRPRLAAIGLCLLLTLSLKPAFAQSTAGTLTGSVTDQAGAIVPDAQVGITNKATGQTLQTATNAEGTYSAPRISQRNLRHHGYQNRLLHGEPEGYLPRADRYAHL